MHACTVTTSTSITWQFPSSNKSDYAQQVKSYNLMILITSGVAFLVMFGIIWYLLALIVFPVVRGKMLTAFGNPVARHHEKLPAQQRPRYTDAVRRMIRKSTLLPATPLVPVSFDVVNQFRTVYSDEYISTQPPPTLSTPTQPPSAPPRAFKLARRETS